MKIKQLQCNLNHEITSTQELTNRLVLSPVLPLPGFVVLSYTSSGEEERRDDPPLFSFSLLVVL